MGPDRFSETTTMATPQLSREDREKQLREILQRQGPEELHRIYHSLTDEQPYIGMLMIQTILFLEYGPPEDRSNVQSAD